MNDLRTTLMIQMIFAKLGCDYFKLDQTVYDIEQMEFAKTMRESAERKLDAEARELYVIPHYKEPEIK